MRSGGGAIRGKVPFPCALEGILPMSAVGTASERRDTGGRNQRGRKRGASGKGGQFENTTSCEEVWVRLAGFTTRHTVPFLRTVVGLQDCQ